MPALEVVAGARFTARRVLPGGHELEGHVEHVAPAHATLDAGAREARVGKKGDAHPAIEYGLNRLVGSLARTRGDEAVVLLGEDLALVELEHVEDCGLEQGHATAALNLIGEKPLVRPMSPSARSPLLSSNMALPTEVKSATVLLRAALGEKVCLIKCEHADEGVQV